MMKIKDIPFYNRPGFKLTRNGVHSLDDAELLAIIFWANDKENDDLSLSNRILMNYNLNKIENAGYKELVNLICKKKKAEYKDFMKAMKLMSLIELAKRYNKLVNNGHTRNIRSAKDVYNIFSSELSNLKKEKVIGVYLDTKNKIIKKEVLGIGILDGSLVHPRELFKEAIKESAKSVILIHNHPSGDANPSDEDINLTKNLIESGNLIGINFLDHIVIGRKSFYSFKEDRLVRV